MIETVHKPKHTFEDGGCRRRLILVEAISDIFDEDEALQEQFATVASEISAKYLNIHPYLVWFEENYGASRSCTRLYCHVSKKQ